MDHFRCQLGLKVTHSFNSWEGGINPKEIERGGPPWIYGPISHIRRITSRERREIGGPLLSLLVIGRGHPSGEAHIP